MSTTSEFALALGVIIVFLAWFVPGFFEIIAGAWIVMIFIALAIGAFDLLSRLTGRD
jgi:hypothetical protein